ncbi:MAG: DUF456 domain-containing protein [Kiritimatiellales bacterium]|nr:DUF456 domain-containing protein [Kiritimatiellales bacterium]
MAFDWHSIGEFFVYAIAVLLCLLGIGLSCLSLFGTWTVLLATTLLAWIRWPDFPGLATLAVFLVLCIGAEILEAVAGSWGVVKRGGSKAAGWAALGGGILGMFLGSFIPIPIIGSLLGMLIGSFGCAFWVEHARMKKTDHAAHVAFGAVLARIAVIFLKLGLTLIMIFTLVLGIAL